MVQDLFAWGLGWLADQLHDNAGTLVTYRSGSDSVEVYATLGSQLLRVTDGRGNTKTERTERDFLIRAADLVIAGETITPARGDHIDVTFGDTVERFEVMPVGGEPPWRYADPHEKTLRIHAKFVSNVGAEDGWQLDFSVTTYGTASAACL